MRNFFVVILAGAALALSVHNVTLYANDTAGNLNYSTVYFTVDTVAPTITWNLPTDDNSSAIVV